MPVTLLAVDDSVTMRKVLEMTFAGEDYRVVIADSADAALAMIRSERPAIVLADATMEGKSGYDLCQQIKRETPGIPVLILSSKLHPYDSSKGHAAKVDDHIDKPFDTQQIIDKVRAVVTAPSAQAATQVSQVSPKPPAVAAQRVAPPATALGVRPAPPHHGKPTPPPGPVAPAVRAAPPVGVRAAPAPVAPAPVAHPAQTRPAVAPAAPVAAAPVAAKPAPAAAAPHVTVPFDGDLAKKLAGLGLSREQVDGVLLLSHDVIERVVWEVVPVLAEAMIKEEIARLTAE